jgi:23S rRNA (cytosine1962-C5)-methyltransferase
MHNDYELLDSGGGHKLESFGDVVLSRPCGQATWEPQRPHVWVEAAASYDRESGWSARGGAELPASWDVTINDITLRLTPTPAGHLGVFPETRALGDRIGAELAPRGTSATNVLNLFAYSGGATLAAARTGCSVCHVDSSKAMVTRARQNAALNDLENAPIRWIVEDVGKFLDREIRRGRRYDAILLDPPSFGRGVKGEQYRLDRDLAPTMERCRALLSENPAFVLLTSHTQGVTTAQLESLMQDVLEPGTLTSGAMQLTGASGVRSVGDGVWAQWSRE